MIDETEKELIAGIRARSRQAMSAAMSRYGRMVAGVVGMMVCDSRDAEELVQDTFINAFRDIRSFRPQEASLATWLGRIAYHRAVDMLRKRRIAYDNLDEAFGLSEAEEEPPNAAVDELRRALQLLSPAERTLITLIYFDNQAVADVAYIMETTPGAISARLFRIKSKLARIINEQRRLQK